MPPSQRDIILAPGAPAPIGPYSVGVRADGLIFTAGQIGLDGRTGELAPGGIRAETRQALLNLQAVLSAGGSSMSAVVKTSVYMVELSEFAEMNAVYAEFFTDRPPARSTVGVAALPKGARVEIECVAIQVAGT